MLTTSLTFPLFRLMIHSNHRSIFNLIQKHFPHTGQGSGRRVSGEKKLTIDFFYHKTRYVEIPRSPNDCFQNFTIFQRLYNQYNEGGQIHLDVGPRTLKTIIDPPANTITSYIATPPDIEQDLLFDLIFFQPLKYLLEFHHLFLFHASLVAKNQNGVLFTGLSGSGKSVLSLYLLQNGFDYASDDEVILKREGSGVACHAFPSYPKIKKILLPIFPELKKSSSSPGHKKDKILLNVNRDFPEKIIIKTNPRILVFPQFSRSKMPSLARLDKGAVLKRLKKWEFMCVKPSNHYVSGRHADILKRLVAQTQPFCLTYNDQNLPLVSGIMERLVKR